MNSALKMLMSSFLLLFCIPNVSNVFKYYNNDFPHLSKYIKYKRAMRNKWKGIKNGTFNELFLNRAVKRKNYFTITLSTQY